MRILFSSPAFAPGIGGLETVVAILAEQLTRLGQEVVVVTETSGAPGVPDRAPYRIVRRPGPRELLRLARWCEVFLQANVSLRGLWPLLLVRRPWAVSHHSWYCRTDGRVAWQDRLKRSLLRFAAVSISVSRAMAADLGTPSLVIANPYRDELFRTRPEVPRTRDLVFVGRLVSDKGADLLLEALARLAGRGLRPCLTIVGDGPERPALTEQARRLGIADRVELAGIKTDGELVDLLNRHRILVAPSRYHEPFGVVALEAIACGCVVAGSSGGGLPEAMGPCGRTFRNGDAGELAELLAGMLSAPESLDALRRHAAEHLASHTGERVAKRYLDALRQSRQAC
jgi:glycogen(starch) synthase